MIIGELSSLSNIISIGANDSRGGWEMRFRVLSDTDAVDINQRVYFRWSPLMGYDYLYGWDGRWFTGFDGYVLPHRFTFDAAGSRVSVVAQTSDGFLRRAWLQGVGFQDRDTTARDHYHQFDSVTGVAPERMTMGRIVRHILGYYDQLGVPPATNPDWVAHTNFVYHPTQNPHGWITLENVTTTPFAWPGTPDGSMRVDRYIVRESKNLWETIRGIANNEFFVAYFDKHDNFHYKRHPMFAASPPGAVCAFTRRLVVGKPVVNVRLQNQKQQVKLHAVTDSGTTLHSTYPASKTFVYGNVHDQSYIRCNSQDALDHWAQCLYLYMNRPYTVQWTLPGLSGLLFEINDPVAITYQGTSQNGVHLNWYNEKFWISNIMVYPRGQNTTGVSVLTLESDNGISP